MRLFSYPKFGVVLLLPHFFAAPLKRIKAACFTIKQTDSYPKLRYLNRKERCFNLSPTLTVMNINYSLLINDATFLDFEDKFWTKRNFEYLKLLLALLHKIDIKSVSPLVVRNKDEIEKFYKAIRKQTALPEKFHHGGPCLPGIRRLFVTVDGRFFPCERVSEKADFMCIGSLQEGFDLKQINVILNSGKLTEIECMECWDLCDCNICIGQMNTASTNDITKEDKMPACQKSKYITMNKLVEICVLRELGYQFSQEGVLS